MIQLSSKIKVYDNGATFNNVKLISTPPVYNMATTTDVDIVEVINNETSSNVVPNVRPMSAFSAFAGIRADLMEIDTNDIAFTTSQGNFVTSNPIINITSDTAFSDLLISWGKGNSIPSEILLLTGERLTRSKQFVFTNTGRSFEGRYEYIAEYDMPNSPPNRTIEKISSPTHDIASVRAVRLKNKTYMFAYLRQAGAEKLTMGITTVYRTSYKALTIPFSFFMVSLDTPTTDLSIMVTGTSVLYRFPPIYSIMSEYNIYQDRINTKSISSNIIDRADIELPRYGVISNDSDIEFVDVKKDVERLFELGLMDNRNPIDIYLENTLTKKKVVIDSAYVQDVDYDKYNFTVKAKIKDDLEDWQYIQLPKHALAKDGTLYSLYSTLKSITPTKFVFEDLDSETESILKNTNCPTLHLEAGSLWSMWTKLCEAVALHIFKKGGKVIVKHSI